MSEIAFDVAAYLSRIGLRGDVEISLDGLQQVHRHQLFSIPFENFDIMLGRGVNLDPTYQFDKLVHHQRGGYCFEVNGLLLSALQALGFDARPVLARVHGEGYVGGRDHLVALVSFNGEQWIADAGFGRESPRSPLTLQLNRDFENERQKLRFVDGEHLGTLLQVETDTGWMPMYSFDLEFVGEADIKYANHYTSTHPDSHFTQRRVGALPVEGGVVTLSDQKLTIRKDGDLSEIYLPDSPEYLDLIRQHFGIELDCQYDELKPLAEH